MELTKIFTIIIVIWSTDAVLSNLKANSKKDYAIVSFIIIWLTKNLFLQSYLRKFGYIDNSTSNITSDQLRQSIIAFQTFAELQVSGVLDDKTFAKMHALRCGNVDIEPSEYQVTVTGNPLR